MTMIFLALFMYGLYLAGKRAVGLVKRNPMQTLQLAGVLRRLAKR